MHRIEGSYKFHESYGSTASLEHFQPPEFHGLISRQRFPRLEFVIPRSHPSAPLPNRTSGREVPRSPRQVKYRLSKNLPDSLLTWFSPGQPTPPTRKNEHNHRLGKEYPLSGLVLPTTQNSSVQAGFIHDFLMMDVRQTTSGWNTSISLHCGDGDWKQPSPVEIFQ